MSTRRALASLPRRAFTLIEAVMVVVVLAIAVPPTMLLLDQSANERADSVAVTRATTYAQGVMEHVLADVSSTHSTRGFAALSNISTYIDAPTTGLRARLQDMSTPYTNAGMRFDLRVSDLVSASGTATGDAARDVFRVVTVTVSFPSARQSSNLAVSMSSLVTRL
jgi:type II secretory pathway pseudopilin PulG